MGILKTKILIFSKAKIAIFSKTKMTKIAIFSMPQMRYGWSIFSQLTTAVNTPRTSRLIQQP